MPLILCFSQQLDEILQRLEVKYTHPAVLNDISRAAVELVSFLANLIKLDVTNTISSD